MVWALSVLAMGQAYKLPLAFVEEKKWILDFTTANMEQEKRERNYCKKKATERKGKGERETATI